jgi:hypothetical protein
MAARDAGPSTVSVVRPSRFGRVPEIQICLVVVDGCGLSAASISGWRLPMLGTLSAVSIVQTPPDREAYWNTFGTGSRTRCGDASCPGDRVVTLGSQISVIALRGIDGLESRLPVHHGQVGVVDEATWALPKASCDGGVPDKSERAVAPMTTVSIVVAANDVAGREIASSRMLESAQKPCPAVPSHDVIPCELCLRTGRRPQPPYEHLTPRDWDRTIWGLRESPPSGEAGVALGWCNRSC